MATYGTAVYGTDTYASSGADLTAVDAAALGIVDTDISVQAVGTTGDVLISWTNPTVTHVQRVLLRSLTGTPPDPTSPQSVILLKVDATNPTDPNTNTTSFSDHVPPGSEVYYALFLLVETTDVTGSGTSSASASLRSASTLTVTGTTSGSGTASQYSATLGSTILGIQNEAN